MSQKYVAHGAMLTCSQGTAPATLQVTSNFTVTSENKAIATELDKAPMVNIPPFAICGILTKTSPVPCVPAPIMWTNTHPTNKCCNAKTLLEKSTIQCAIGGKISITTPSQFKVSTGASVEGQKTEQIQEIEPEKSTDSEQKESNNNKAPTSSQPESKIDRKRANKAKLAGIAISPTQGLQGNEKNNKDNKLQSIKSIDDLEDLNLLAGAKWEEVEQLIPKDWVKKPLKKGDGVKFINPHKKGEQVLLEKGWPNMNDPLHKGPYIKISRNGKIERIPLKGNPVLK